MEDIKTILLRSIGSIFEQTQGCMMEEDIFFELAPELLPIERYFGVTRRQAFFVAHVFALNYRGNPVDLSDLTEHFNCNPVRILEFSEDFEVLKMAGILEHAKSRHRVEMAMNNEQYSINGKITRAIMTNQPMPELESPKYEKLIEVLEGLYQLVVRRDSGEMTTVGLYRQTERIIRSNDKFTVIADIIHQGLKIRDGCLYLCMVWKTIMGEEHVNLARAVAAICERTAERVELMQELITGRSRLIRKGFIEIQESNFFNDLEGKLTQFSIGILRKEGIQLKNHNRNRIRGINPGDIPARELFYDEAVTEQIGLIEQVMMDAKLKRIQRRLKKRSLPQGITVLLYGPPGSGKTETVYQLARKSGREIMAVDISQSKSMWFGQSEKAIKKIFTDYRDFASDSRMMPVLLFNEADAIISKRKDVALSSVAQTENAIQNIILEELEKFEGIFFATTNLVTNLDMAFERRFLFKVLLPKPGKLVRAKIWRSKLRSVSLEQCMHLAAGFDLSGGQIDNIVRKSEMEEVVSGRAFTLESLMAHCRQERIALNDNNRIKIGYLKNN